jgi:predicted RNase H-like HicB family nuclease
MMDPFRYRIVVEWSDEDARFLARVPALPGCVAHGKTEALAAREARKAAEAMLAVLAEDGDAAPPIDTAADFSGQTRLRLPRSLHAQLSRVASAEGVSLNSLLLTRLSGARTEPKSDDADSASHDRPTDMPRLKLKKSTQRKSA